MGNAISGERSRSSYWWSSSSNGHVPINNSNENSAASAPTAADNDAYNDVKQEESENEDKDEGRVARTLSPAKAKELEEFKQQLAKKREARKDIIAKKTREMKTLKEQLEEERRLKEEAINENNVLRELLNRNNVQVDGLNVSEQEVELSENSAFKTALAELEHKVVMLKEQSVAIRAELSESNLALQSVNAETALLNKENFELKNQIKALKDVNKVSKQMLAIREAQLTQLKEKLSDIEKSLADRELRTLSSDLRTEYERQLENIRSLKLLYEERARVAEQTKLGLVRDLEEQKSQTELQTTKCGELETRIEELEKEVSDKDDILGSKESQLGLSKAENKGLQTEMTLINQLFSQMLLGCSTSADFDLDRLLSRLQEHHELLADLAAREDSKEMAAALPKLILDIARQLDGEQTKETDKNDDPAGAREDGAQLGNQSGEEKTEDQQNDAEAPSGSKAESLSLAQEMTVNLPKVWRVLTELLSHQAAPLVLAADGDNICYNQVDTPSGPRLVPSVSKTYIRLKDLILEKKSLQKEMNRLKQLNAHLENRFSDQERRLGLVSSELSKTWHIVGRMQRQHQQLHTHEKILRFELQEKRLMLTELKEELEYCKDKWDRAKQKNSESQIEWNKLRMEFASRKLESTDSIKDSGESGYSDERASDEDSVDLETEKKSDSARSKRKSNTLDVNGLDKSFDGNDQIDAEQIAVVEAVQSESETVTSDAEDKMVGNVDELEVAENAEVTDAEDESSIAETSVPGPSYEDVLAARSARLKKLEEQCYVLVHKVTKTNNKGVQLCNRLEELHNQYGGSTEENNPQPSTSQQNKDTGSAKLGSLEVENEPVAPISNEDDGVETCRETVNNDEANEVDGSISNNCELNEDASVNNDFVMKKDDEEVQSNKIEAGGLENDKESLETQKESSETDKECSGTNKECSETNKERSETNKESSDTDKETSERDKLSSETGIKCLETDKECLETEKDSSETNTEIKEAHENSSEIEKVSSQSGKESTKTLNADLDKPGPSNSLVMDYEARFAARDERLKRMEEQASSLVTKVSNTSTRGVRMCSKLDDLHNTYGRSEEKQEASTEPAESQDDVAAKEDLNGVQECNESEYKQTEENMKE